MHRLEIPENNKQLILKLICNEIMKRHISNDVECLKELIINNEIKYYLIRLKVYGGYIFINEETKESGIINVEMYINPYNLSVNDNLSVNENKLYFYSKELYFQRGFTYF